MTGEPARAPFTIAYQDEHLLVVDKGADLVVHPARGHRGQTLSQLLAPLLAGEVAQPAGTAGQAHVHEAHAGGATAPEQGGREEQPGADDGDEEWEDPSRPGIVHRLDRGTSGLLVVARTPEAHRRLQRAISARRIEREYLALVEGRPPARSGTIEAPIGRDPRVRTRMAVDGAGAREARTHFTLERALPASSLLRVRLDTGRTHQIRVHMRAIGHPLCGDPEYGTAGLLGLQRQFLHAARLAFEHPFTGEPIEVTSPLPEDLRRALAAAERLS
ncbi:MAG TPA: RluA family pseudouridine synthase [Solirubrobacteraceae bacterium]|nr:RluA family pseudouridine synthase [Solirubrobacteraceae bacterium]